MSTFVVAAGLIWVFVFVIGALALLLKWKLPYLIGRSGERFVARQFRRLDAEHYAVLDDLLLPSQGNTRTTQIDHVVVSNYGVFVIETKSYSGWIFGDAREEVWTQVIYRFKKRFYNPLRQNYAHVRAIEALVRPRFPSVPIVGFVAFPDADRLEIRGTEGVGHARDIVRKVQSFTTEAVSNDGKARIVEILRSGNIQDKATRAIHDREALALKDAKGL
jgi:hypothetical protein